MGPKRFDVMAQARMARARNGNVGPGSTRRFTYGPRAVRGQIGEFPDAIAAAAAAKAWLEELGVSL